MFKKLKNNEEVDSSHKGSSFIINDFDNKMIELKGLLINTN